MTDYIRDLRPAEWGSGVGCTAVILSRSCPLWVKKQTSGHVQSMSALPRKRTFKCLLGIIHRVPGKAVIQNQ
jgi:phosphoribosyl-AMP cyclohydrolase